MDVLAQKDIVKNFLARFPRLRESDEKLIANMWSNFLKKEKGLNTLKMSAHELLKMLSESQLPNYESVSRCSRRLKEKFPMLRGKNYNERLAEEKNIIDQVKRI